MNNSNNNLQQSVQSTITTFLENRITANSDIAVDVYRAIRDEAQLLLERQLIFDTFDADPFELMKVSSTAEDDGSASSEKDLNEDEVSSDNKGEKHNNDDIHEKQKNAKVIKRIKNILHVISCTRTATLDGYVRVYAVVELRNDGRMDKCVNENIRLHFTFLREPQHDDFANESSVDENAVESSSEEQDSNAKQSSERNNDNSNSDTEQPAKKKRKGMNKHDDVSPIDSKDETADDIIHTQQSNNCNSQGLTPKTIITYKIDYSIDYGKMEQLLGVDIYALGEHPSVETAVQMFDDDDDDNDNEEVNDDMEEGTYEHLLKDDEEARNNSCGGCCDTKGACNKMKDNSVKQSTNNKSEFEDIEMSDDDDNSNCCNKDDIEDKDDNNRADRFGVFINPENVVSFLNLANINFNEHAVFYFLLTFPFYEHEWEIAGFILSALGEDEEEDDGLEEGDEKDDCEISNGCEIGCSGGKSCCS